MAQAKQQKKKILIVKNTRIDDEAAPAGSEHTLKAAVADVLIGAGKAVPSNSDQAKAWKSNQENKKKAAAKK